MEVPRFAAVLKLGDSCRGSLHTKGRNVQTATMPHDGGLFSGSLSANLNKAPSGSILWKSGMRSLKVAVVPVDLAAIPHPELHLLQPVEKLGALELLGELHVCSLLRQLAGFRPEIVLLELEAALVDPARLVHYRLEVDRPLVTDRQGGVREQELLEGRLPLALPVLLDTGSVVGFA